MSQVAGVATSYDLPNYVGELFQKAERPNALLRLIGGLTGNLRKVTSTEFAMGVDYTLPAASQPAILEGANPTASEQNTGQSTNLVQIFQEAVSLTYSKMGRTGGIDGVAVIPGMAGNGALNLPGSLEWQIARKLEKIARDANYTFLQGAYQKPADNTTARKTRGLITAVTTNVFANGGTGRAISTAIVDGALQSAMGNGMFNIGDTIFAICDQTQYGKLAALYEGTPGTPRYTDTTEVVGVGVRQVLTKWAKVNLVWDPDMPAGKVLLTRPDVCRVVAYEVPGKGLLFAEPLAQTGSAENWQVYGEMGLDYKNEIFHAVIGDLS